MNTRTLCGRTVRPIGLGCMNLSWAYGDPPPHEDKVRLLNEALDLGYDHLDTANIYGKGANEELLGDARTRGLPLCTGSPRSKARIVEEAFGTATTNAPRAAAAPQA